MTNTTNKQLIGKTMRTVGLLAAAAIMTAAIPASKAAETPGSPVIMKGADVLVLSDLAKIRNSSINQEIEKLQEDAGDSSQTPFNVEKYEELGQQLQEITGLTENDFKSFAIAGKLDNVELTKNTDIQELNIAFALNLAKPLPLDKLEEGLRKAAAANEDVENATFERTSIGKHDVLAVKNDQEETNLEQLLFASVQGNKTILGGTQTGITSALDRIDNDAILSVDEEFGGWPQEEGIPHTGVIFNPTREMLNKAKKLAETTQQQRSQQQPQDQTKEAFIKILPHIERLVLTVDCTDKMYFNLHGVMDSAQQAEKLTSLLRQPVISMTQATLTMLTGGKRLNLTQSLNAEVKDNTHSVLSFQLSSDDLKTLQEMNKKRAQGSNSKGS